LIPLAYDILGTQQALTPSITMNESMQPAGERSIPDGLSGEVLVVNSQELLPGDVVLSTAAGFSRLIWTATSSLFSHVAFHVGHGTAIKANDPGVVQVHLLQALQRVRRPQIGYPMVNVRDIDDGQARATHS
jgi:hypothetical protein